MDKIIAIKVKNTGGGYDEIPITALAQNVYWNSNLNLNLKDNIIGDIDSIKDDNQQIVPLQTQINNLDNKKANINSPIFTGNPKIKVDNEDFNIATENFVQEQNINHLTINDLKLGNSQSALSSSDPTSIGNRQYPVIKDVEGKLSVNVPWQNTIFSSTIEKFWTGTCSDSSNSVIKVIILDNTSQFPNNLIGNEKLAIYFKNKNTTRNPQLQIRNVRYPIGILDSTGNVQLIETTSIPFYRFGSGLKFFTYDITNNCWLLSTADYSLISYLNSNKANINSPAFTGTPTISTTLSANDNSNKIATTSFVKGQIVDQLTKNNLKTSTQTNRQSSNPVSVQGRQYPVVFDNQNKLSVNVPWTDSGGTIKNVSKLWTGVVNTENSIPNKNVELNNNNAADGYGGLINISVSSAEGEVVSIAENASILIYFTKGNGAISPKLVFNFNGADIVKDILYQTETNNYLKLENNSLYYRWGSGLKIFTYVKYKDGTVDKDGWLINSFDGLTINILNQKISTLELDLNNKINNKANIVSPNLREIPTTPTPRGNVSNQITNVEYVNSECLKVLNSDENYAFQLKEKNGNNNIFTVDWEGKANGVDLNCISTKGIITGGQGQTILGRYNKVVKNPSVLYCDAPEAICSDELIVGATDEGVYPFVIGNGTDNENRFNAFTIDWNGQVRSCNPNVSADEYYYPSSDTWFTHYSLVDSNNYTYGRIQSVFTSGNEIGLSIQVNREISNSYFQNNLNLFIDRQGVPRVSLSAPWAWRDALGFQKKTLVGPSKIWNGVTIVVYCYGNIVTCVVYGSENGNWGAGVLNAYYTLPVGYRPHTDIQQIIVDQNNKRAVWAAKSNGQIGIYWLLDSITSKTNMYGCFSWAAWS